MTNEKNKEQEKRRETKETKKLHEGKVERAESWPEPPEDNDKESDDS